MILGAFFALCAVSALVGLVLVDLRAVPPVAGTCAFILTLAVLGTAILR